MDSTSLAIAPNATVRAAPIDELNVARSDYARYSAKAADLDMRLIANAAERDRLEDEHKEAERAKGDARSRVFEIENQRARPQAPKATVLSAATLNAPADTGLPE